MARTVSDLDEEIYGRGGRSQRALPLVRVVDGSTPKALYRITDGWAEKDIPSRPWVAPGYLLRGAVTILAGPGSAGKSSLVVAWTAAHSMGVPWGRFRSFTHEPMRSLSYNVEDDADELRRRYSGMCRRLGTTPAALLENLVLVGPNEIGTLLGLDRMGGLLVNTRAMDELEQVIGDTKPDTVCLDPFVELHDVEENDNTAIRLVMARFRSIAKQYKCAMAILFHTRKGLNSPGDPDAIRGASSIVGAGRIALTANVMTKEEANDLGVNEEFRRDYFRLDDAKKNYSRTHDAEWFERVEIELDNGDCVAIPVPWSPATTSVDQGALSRLVEVIAKGTESGPYSITLGAYARSISNALVAVGIDGRAAQRQAVNQLKASGLVEIRRYRKGDKARSDCPQGFRALDGRPANVEWWEDDDA